MNSSSKEDIDHEAVHNQVMVDNRVESVVNANGGPSGAPPFAYEHLARHMVAEKASAIFAQGHNCVVSGLAGASTYWRVSCTPTLRRG
jgi:hypothetical protein